ncbi:MAG TPA: TolC family protein [Pirellulales bacterium]
MNRFGMLALLLSALSALLGPSPARAQTTDPESPSSRWRSIFSKGSQVSYYPGYLNGPAPNGAGAAAAPPAMTPPTASPGGSKSLTSLSGPVTPASFMAPPLNPASLRQAPPPTDPSQGPEILPTPRSPAGGPATNPPGQPGQMPQGDLPPLQSKVDLQPAPLEANDFAFAINLATALRLADARPLIVSAAQASAWVGEAQLQHAKVLWVPTFNMGGDYVRHDGYGPDFNLGINTAARPLNQNVNFLYSGIGFTQQVAVTDAIFEPLAARQVLNSRRWDIQTAKNDALLATANAYFSVHQYRGQYAAAIDVVNRGRRLVERLQVLSQDLVPRVEVDRGERLLADMEQQAATLRQMWRVASADLTQVLRLDPRVMVVPQEHDHLQITLIDPSRPLDELIPIGLTNRPELASQQALVKAVAERIRREKGRLLLPTAMLNGFQTPNELIQFGAQGIGHGDAMNLWSLRDDLSPQLMWQYEGLGFGNMARIKEQRGEQSGSIVEMFKLQDAVAGDVVRGQARLQSAAVRVVQAERSMEKALLTFNGNYEGLSQTTRFGNVLIQVYRPQEVVIALQHLMTAYTQYFSTVADYNRAQFELFHALGYPAREVAALRPPGDAEPVNTSRPGYLPPVDVGPPPASR